VGLVVVVAVLRAANRPRISVRALTSSGIVSWTGGAGQTSGIAGLIEVVDLSREGKLLLGQELIFVADG